VASSSSAKKVARLASRGKGKRVRFQGGSVFPIAVALVVLLGLFAIIYGRQSLPSNGAGSPTINDHWHQAFGIYVCDTFQPKLTGTKEETTVDSAGNTVLVNQQFSLTGIHSHGDGIIHYHPNSTKSTGNRAKLGVFLDVYGVKLDDTSLTMPKDQGGESWSTKDTKCNGKPVELRARVWDHYTDPNNYHDVVTDFNNIRITNDGMVIAIGFVPKGADIPMPDWAAQLPTLGASDSGQVLPTPTTVAGVLPGATTPASAVPPTVAPEPTTTAPAPTTTGG
jgi:hypothetical protein